MGTDGWTNEGKEGWTDRHDKINSCFQNSARAIKLIPTNFLIK
jgi:hypothetical protein